MGDRNILVLRPSTRFGDGVDEENFERCQIFQAVYSIRGEKEEKEEEKFARRHRNVLVAACSTLALMLQTLFSKCPETRGAF